MMKHLGMVVEQGVGNFIQSDKLGLELPPPPSHHNNKGDPGSFPQETFTNLEATSWGFNEYDSCRQSFIKLKIRPLRLCTFLDVFFSFSQM